MSASTAGDKVVCRTPISSVDQKRIGSLIWYTTTVKLELEVRGEIERIVGATPQRVRRR